MPHRDERVDVTARCRDTGALLLVDGCADALLWAAPLLAVFAAVALLLAAVLLIAALGAAAGAAVLVVATAVDV